MTLNFETMSEQQLWAIADPIMDNLMDASTQIDHARHVRDFTGRLKAIVTPDYLARICQQYQAEKGYFTTRTLIAIFRRPNSVALVWKQSSRKHRANLSRKWCWCIGTEDIGLIM